MKAIFPSGINEITVEAVTQWDYGQTLEFEGDLPALFEVHFAHKGLKEAIVRSCSIASGVIIPDICIEQTGIIVAWIYEISETSGKTVKTVYIPITPRVRPEPTKDVPVIVSDKYTESIATINDLIGVLDSTHSATSDFATQAGKANHAGNADVAIRAIGDGFGNDIHETYATKADLMSGDVRPYNAEFAEIAIVARKAQMATADANGNDIRETYATKEEITNPILEVENAKFARMATADANGNVIHETYLTEANSYLRFARPTHAPNVSGQAALYPKGAIIVAKSDDTIPIEIGTELTHGITEPTSNKTVYLTRVEDGESAVLITDTHTSLINYVVGGWIVIAKYVSNIEVTDVTDGSTHPKVTKVDVSYRYLLQRID